MWLNNSKDDQGRRAIAQAIPYMQDSPSVKLPPKDAAMYFAAPLSMFISVKGGKLDLYPNGDRSYAVFHFWRVCEAGLLGKLRQCPHPKCKEWFYAVRSDKEFCGKHRRTTEHGALSNKAWRIEKVFLPTVRDRIAKYKTTRRSLTKVEQERLGKAIQRQAKLKADLKQVKLKLNELKSRK